MFFNKNKKKEDAPANAGTSSGGISRSLSKATQLITGAGPPPHKQLKQAIIDGNEEKAIQIYISKEGGKSLMSSLQPSEPFPSKKVPNDEQTPLHLTAKFAHSKLFNMFLEYGGIPSVINARGETCIHSVCTLASNPVKRGDMLEMIIQWRGHKNDSKNSDEKVNVDHQDIDGNTALHMAAANNLLPCVQVLVEHQAQLTILNFMFKSSAEMADSEGHNPLGTMLELAWVFLPVNQPPENFYKFASEKDSIARVILDANSLTVAGLVQFINQAIKFISAALGENSARSEALLHHYKWDASLLKKEYLADAVKVLTACNLKPKPGNLSLTTGKNKLPDEVNVGCGVPIEEVFVDPSYKSGVPFVVYRDGVKHGYSIRNFNGKTCVQPVELDSLTLKQLNMMGDHDISELARTNPKSTDNCPTCNKIMYESIPVQQLVAGGVALPMQRELTCSSGHKFCFSCWSDNAQDQVMNFNVGCMKCLDPKCGEQLDLSWAPALLKSPDLVNRLLTQRQKGIIDCVNLQWCPVDNCGHLIHIGHAYNNQAVNGNIGCCGGGLVPMSAFCTNGHGLCLACGEQSHSPLPCADVAHWQEQLREEIRLSDVRNPNNILVNCPTEKPCPNCSEPIYKNEGPNHMCCNKCRYQFCWTCSQEWALHNDKQGNFFQCNRFMDPETSSLVRGNSAGNAKMLAASADSGDHWQQEEKTDSAVPDIHRRVRSAKSAIFAHQYVRYQSHSESRRIESVCKTATIPRIVSGLKQSKDGQLVWLHGEEAPNPYKEGQQDDVFNNLKDLNTRDVKDTVLSQHFVNSDSCVKFLVEAFEELEKCRSFLQWSYVLALFEFEESFRSSTPRPSAAEQASKEAQRISARLSGKNTVEDTRLAFEALQCSLEVKTELLSDMIARDRMRGTKNQIILATRAARGNRSQMEAAVLNMFRARDAAERERLAALRAGSSASPLVENVKAPTQKDEPAKRHKQESIRVGYEDAYGAGEDDDNRIITDQSQIFAGLASNSKERVSVSKQAPTKTQFRGGSDSEQNKSPTTTTPNKEVVYISHDDAVAVDALANKYGFAREDAVRVYFENTDHLTYNPNAMYIFPSEDDPEDDEPQLAVLTQDALALNNSLFVQSSTSPAPIAMRKFEEKHSMRPTDMSMSGLGSPHIGPDQTFSTYEQERQAYYNAQYGINNPPTHFEDEDDGDEIANLPPDERGQKLRSASQDIGYGYGAEGYAGGDNAVAGGYEGYGAQGDDGVEQRVIGEKIDPDEEALQHAILLSNQDSEYGVNMYDSLTPADEPVIEEYVEQGFTREEAILIIFEDKYGRVASQPAHITPAMPSLHKGPMDEQAIADMAPQDRQQVDVLMGRGYTREQAVAEVLREVSRRNSNIPLPAHFQQEQQQGWNRPDLAVNTNRVPPMSQEDFDAAVENLMHQGYPQEEAERIVDEEDRMAQMGIVPQHGGGGGGGRVTGARSNDTDDYGYGGDVHDFHPERDTGGGAHELSPIDEEELEITEDDIAILMDRGYTHEQAVAELESQREIAIRRRDAMRHEASQNGFSNGYNRGGSGVGGGGYYPQPHEQQPPHDEPSPLDEEEEIALLMERGYTMEQAEAEYRRQVERRERLQHEANQARQFEREQANMQSHHQHYDMGNSGGYSAGGGYNSNPPYQDAYGQRQHHGGGGGGGGDDMGMGDVDPEEEIEILMGRGYTREQAEREFQFQQESLERRRRAAEEQLPPEILREYENQRNSGGGGRMGASGSSLGGGSDAGAYSQRGARLGGPEPALNSPNNVSGGPNTEEDALQKVLLLSQQEAEYGISMYDALTPEDDPEIERLRAEGYSVDDAILIIFETRYPPLQGRTPVIPFSQQINAGGPTAARPLPALPAGEEDRRRNPPPTSRSIYDNDIGGGWLELNPYDDTPANGRARDPPRGAARGGNGAYDDRRDGSPDRAALSSGDDRDDRDDRDHYRYNDNEDSRDERRGGRRSRSPRSERSVSPQPKSRKSKSFFGSFFGGASEEEPKNRKSKSNKKGKSSSRNRESSSRDVDAMTRAIRMSERGGAGDDHQDDDRRRRRDRESTGSRGGGSRDYDRDRDRDRDRDYRDSHRGGRNSPRNSSPRGSPNKVTVHADDVEALTQMGFTPDQAVQALMENNNDLERAANSLSASSRAPPPRRQPQYDSYGGSGGRDSYGGGGSGYRDSYRDSYGDDRGRGRGHSGGGGRDDRYRESYRGGY